MANATKKTRWVIYSACAVLLFGGGLQLWGFRDVQHGDRSSPVRAIGLGERFPRTLPGWSGRDEPLGPSEAVRGAVERNLNYDDYVFRIFEQRGTRFGIYVAYWAPGRMPVNKVASHTPDRCWVENGWHCETTRFGDVLTAAGAPRLRAGQGR